MGAYAKQINDLVGIGDVFRQFRQFAVFLIQHISERESRKLRNHAQRLRNDEQSLKNQQRKLQYTKSLLALAEKYSCDAAKLQAFADFVTTPQEGGLTKPYSSQNGNAESQLHSETVPLSELISAPCPQSSGRVRTNTKS